MSFLPELALSRALADAYSHTPFHEQSGEPRDTCTVTACVLLAELQKKDGLLDEAVAAMRAYRREIRQSVDYTLYLDRCIDRLVAEREWAGDAVSLLEAITESGDLAWCQRAASAHLGRRAMP